MESTANLNQQEFEDGVQEATEKLLSYLQEEFENRFGEWVNDVKLCIESKGEGKRERWWRFTFEEKMQEVKEIDSGDTREHTVEVKVSSNKNSSETKRFQFRFEKKGSDLILKLKEANKQGRRKSFDLCSVSESDPGEYTITTGMTEMNHKHDKFSRNVVKVWFPNEKTADHVGSALSIPAKFSWLGGSDKPSWWPVLSDKLESPLPSVNFRGPSQGGMKVDTNPEEWMGIALSHLTYYMLCYGYDPANNDDFCTALPDVSTHYKAKRPVSLNPAEVQKRLENESDGRSLYFPWHVVESACAALNAGKNVIFTGPPGCGKSKIAIALARMATGEPLISTASPAWTVGDVIGRYHPKPDGNGLKFKEGFFLKAISNETSWLIIDEFNRADIDACFGELFSVLAGDRVDLPYERFVEPDSDAESGGYEPIRIIPDDRAAEDGDYLVPEEFRLIGTMNDADRSGLKDLSFALMRRFAIIPIESPSTKHLKTIVEEQIDQTTRRLDLDSYGWDVAYRSTHRCSISSVEDVLNKMFSEKDGLVSERVVGVASVKDIIRFVGEGLRGEGESISGDSSNLDNKFANRDYELDGPRVPDKEKKEYKYRNKLELRERCLTLSYLALAIVLQVFPQLEAVSFSPMANSNSLQSTVRHIFESIHTGVRYPKKLPMLRLTKSDKYELDANETISEFLFRNLKQQFPGEADQWRNDLNEYL